MIKQRSSFVILPISDINSKKLLLVNKVNKHNMT